MATHNSIQSINFPTGYIMLKRDSRDVRLQAIDHYENDPNHTNPTEIDPGSQYAEVDKRRSTFIVEAGLADPGDATLVSFQSLSYPGCYLLNDSGLIKLETISDQSSDDMKKQATFKKTTGHAIDLWTSFESDSQPDCYIRHQYFDIKVQKQDSNLDLYNRDTTFFLVPPNWSHEEMLDYHNYWRLLVNHELHQNGVAQSQWLGLLSWSDELASSAQDWANTLADKLTGTDNPVYHSKTQYGENLYHGPIFFTGVMAVAAWVLDEKHRFDHQESGTTGHYTQIVWRDTKSVGCGMATYIHKDGKPRTIWVCQYDPPGNINGQSPYQDARA